ncbi:39S ribosomal protein L54, mitochondrial isoform X1 [Bombus pyrosoma]|uniref:39S ribosomal protein L54, mitochondrial isoform X1 n=1 Tax=Bombus pyrosoma TaxID=396416 RepID=UPI001CB996BB|nr:39S ribosomal protein L54, mitochondrial isoform X1 [Bombus pyrosoma]
MSLLSILRLPRITENIIAIQYTIQVKNYAVVDKKKIKGTKQKIELPVEEDVNKLLNYVCGSNIYKEGEDIKLKPDSEYPEWLWKIRTEPLKLADLDPNTKQYWRYIRKMTQIRNNKIMKNKQF